ncbi:MAG TPA: FAD-dependent oxidoreductase [Hyphomicrobiaceae bacterium]|nr:FAD-dependent oxidoreductase [Hyphomicrobiaceae bacterium]
MQEGNVPVVIAGGGPCGLMLANELGRRGIGVLLVDEKPSTAFNPQANATQARTMEHFRRLGFADEIRALGMPPDFPTDIAYFTRYARHELARFSLPSSKDARTRIVGLTGSWGAAELPHRVSQKFVEATLRRHAEKLQGVSINYGWRLVDFEDTGDAVRCDIERVADSEKRRIFAGYLFGADGPRSFVRGRLGFGYVGEADTVRDFMGGRMFALYIRCPDFYKIVPHAPAWMNVTFNRDRRAYMAAVDGHGEFAFHTQLRAHEDADATSDSEARRMFEAAVGGPIDVEILSRASWIAGRTLVADGFQRGRVLLGGDAVHLFTPAGGLGYNTAVDDAVNIGWKLAAVLKGLARPSLLDTYQIERRPLAVRNTSYARAFADSLGLYEPAPEIEDDTVAGAEARRVAGEHFNKHARAEFNIPGVTFGGRYDGSPIIVPDGTAPPPDSANDYTPTACPGGRAPHVWLADGRSLYDTFGIEWTLLQLRRDSQVAGEIAKAARALGLDLTVVKIERDDLRDLYAADAALIRPDQVVAWRGSMPGDALRVVARASGAEKGEWGIGSGE